MRRHLTNLSCPACGKMRTHCLCKGARYRGQPADVVAERIRLRRSVNKLLEETYAEAVKTEPTEIPAWIHSAVRDMALEEEVERARRRERRNVDATKSDD